MKVGLILAFGVLLCGSQAYAQMYRCTGVGGKTTYSNFPCSASEKVEHVRITDNAIESRELRSYARAQKEQEFERKYGQQEEIGGVLSGDPSQRNSYACSVAIKNASNQATMRRVSPQKIDDDRAKAAQICGYNPWPGKTMVEADMENKRSRAIEAAARAKTEAEEWPSKITRCDQAGCWDDRGVRYRHSGVDGTYYRQDNTVCREIGSQLRCN